jgi:type VI secretion system protein
MSRRGLLARIAGRDGPADEVEAVVRHLRVLLNSRRGGAASAPTLGVTDLSDLAGAPTGGAQQIAASMRATLLEHEPRLRSVAVRHLPADGDLVLHFEIVAQLAGRSGRALRLSTTVRPGGHVEVRG